MRARAQITAAFALATLAASAAAQDNPAIDIVSPNPVARLDLNALSATRDLPLFSPNRSPPIPEPELEFAPAPVVEQVEQPISEVDPPPPAAQLIGIIMTAESRLALFTELGSGDVVRLRPGEKLEGWRLAIIDARTVTLTSNGREHTLKLFTSYSPDPSRESVFPESSPDEPEESRDEDLE